MTEQKKPQTNINDEEVKIIRATFKDNERLLQVTRAIMLGLSVSEDEKELIRSTYSSKPLMKAMRKKFLPKISKEEPIGQISDIWLGVESQVFGQTVTTIKQALFYKKGAVELTEKAFSLLENPDCGATIDIDYDPAIYLKDELGINLLVRNQYIRHVEQQLLSLKVIAEMPEEDVTENTKRYKKDSSK